ncbi:MAG: hypothetical protein BWY45_02064 [Euryarchaeota archaeon ADurb.Bin294]|nr:MAG: hypothetical protein BWY45_02064 [Euryarchaeota archaeon ADurb.Bin294]
MKKLQLMVIEMRKDIGLIWVFILFVAIAMCGCTDVPTGNRYDGMSLQEIQSVAINPGYDSVFRGIEQYQGKVIHITGQVIQAQSDSGRYILRVATIPTLFGQYTDGVYWVNYDGSQGRVRESDLVDMYGEVIGLRTYETVLGSSKTIPELRSLHLSSKAVPTPTPTLNPDDFLILKMDSLRDEGDYVKHNVARGTIQNTAKANLAYASVQVSFYESENGPVIATSSDYVSNLGPGEIFEYKVVNYKDAERVSYARAKIVNARFD